MSYVTNSFDDRVVASLKSGGIGFMPSDTIYGLSCRALDEKAVLRLRQLKSRSEQKPLIVLFSDISQLADLGMPVEGLDQVLPYWPGPLSLEWNASKSPAWLHPLGGTFAVRMPNKPQLLELIRTVGPLTSTSANPEGAPPAKNLAEVQKYFGDKLDFYVDAGEIKDAASSTLVRLKDGKFEILRQGAVEVNN